MGNEEEIIMSPSLRVIQEKLESSIEWKLERFDNFLGKWYEMDDMDMSELRTGSNYRLRRVPAGPVVLSKFGAVVSDIDRLSKENKELKERITCLEELVLHNRRDYK